VAVALRTLRLLLREWRDEDAAPFAAMSADPEVLRYLSAPDTEWIARMRGHFAVHGFGNFVVELPGEAPFIGVIGLNRALTLPFRRRRGGSVARQYWGGLCRRSRPRCDPGRVRPTGLARSSPTPLANLRSRQVMERLGMTRDPAEDFDRQAAPRATRCAVTCSITRISPDHERGHLSRAARETGGTGRRYQGWGDSPLTDAASPRPGDPVAVRLPERTGRAGRQPDHGRATPPRSSALPWPRRAVALTTGCASCRSAWTGSTAQIAVAAGIRRRGISRWYFATPDGRTVVFVAGSALAEAKPRTAADRVTHGVVTRILRGLNAGLPRAGRAAGGAAGPHLPPRQRHDRKCGNVKGLSLRGRSNEQSPRMSYIGGIASPQ
jgi:ribosomal-protein-alanine N-acetyltransferase